MASLMFLELFAVAAGVPMAARVVNKVGQLLALEKWLLY